MGAQPARRHHPRRLIARYGEPVFCKIDVEGYEPRRCWAFAPLQAVSVSTCLRHIAVECIRRLDALGASPITGP